VCLSFSLPSLCLSIPLVTTFTYTSFRLSSQQACDLMNIRLVKVAMDPVTCRIDLDAVKFAVTANTIMLYGSAPSFPQVLTGSLFFCHCNASNSSILSSHLQLEKHLIWTISDYLQLYCFFRLLHPSRTATLPLPHSPSYDSTNSIRTSLPFPRNPSLLFFISTPPPSTGLFVTSRALSMT
jgi:hypothetical protein